MIWIAGAALAFVFVKFGMLLILTKLLTIGLGVAILVSTALAATLIWRKGLVGMLLGKKSLTNQQ